MISPTLRVLLERRAELQELFETLQYRITATQPDAAHQLEQVAERALGIIREWPDEFWPLESEENTWPYRADLIEYLEQDIQKAKDYQSSHPLPFDFDADFEDYMAVSRHVFSSLYCFRGPEEEHNDE